MKKLLCLLILCLGILHAQAQPTGNDDVPDARKKVTLSSGLEGSILQFARLTSGGLTYKTIPRYTYFFNTGVDIDFHAHKNVVLYTGFQLKNIGMITAVNDSIRYKERVYTIGAPAGIKLISSNKKLMLKFGADIALAFNYKRKHFLNDEKIYKYNEFFSSKANLMFASAFAGITVHGVSLTGNYYLTNFYNPSTNLAVGRLYTISLGLHFDNDLITPSKTKTEKRRLY
jgi:hypothetical protein